MCSQAMSTAVEAVGTDVAAGSCGVADTTGTGMDTSCTKMAAAAVH